jgi:hypothetical protein
MTAKTNVKSNVKSTKKLKKVVLKETKMDSSLYKLVKPYKKEDTDKQRRLRNILIGAGVSVSLLSAIGYHLINRKSKQKQIGV